MANRRSYLLAAALLALGAGAAAGGCNLVLGIHDLSETSPSPDAGSPCDADGQCDDQDPCTLDACSAGLCGHVAQPDGPAASPFQIPFDCQVVRCVAGKAETQSDDNDVQPDAEDCTIDQCSGGQAFHTAKPDDTACTMGGDGLCKGGKCQISCTVDAMCNDNNPCTEDSCDLAQALCSFAPLNGVNTPGASQIDHDCNIQVCVDGVSTKSPDDSDLPVTATDCDQELCNNGVPTNPPLDLDVTCGPAKDMRCDGAGSCVQCNSPTQCPGIDNDCQARSCTSHACGITFAPVGTPRAQPFQTIGDCKVVVCDGAGSSGAQAQADGTDLPDDGNKCTMDVCTGGVISHPFELVSTVCGNNSACNATGQCGCANDLACAAPTTCGGGSPGTPFVCGCTLKSCAALGKTCGTVTDGCSSTQNCDNGTKEGTETDIDCGGGGACGDTCAQGKQCNADSDCGTGHCADGVCCNTACTGTCQACAAAKKGGGADGVCGSVALGLQDTNATTTCVGTRVCDGANNCKKIDGQSCGGNTECVSGNCADGVCCNTACNGTCLACSAAKKGAGADGVCGNIPINQQDNAATSPCTGVNACDGNGACKKSAGQTCASNGVCANGNCVDGVCCGVASCSTCQSCALSGTGVCTNIGIDATDNYPVNTCSGIHACNGSGVCLLAPGQPCTLNSECTEGACGGSPKTCAF
jgi:slime mold repeat-containing protein